MVVGGGPPCRYRSLYDICSSTPTRFIKEGGGEETKEGIDKRRRRENKGLCVSLGGQSINAANSLDRKYAGGRLEAGQQG